jgi:two-component system CheB/CheR fusion protein
MGSSILEDILLVTTKGNIKSGRIGLLMTNAKKNPSNKPIRSQKTDSTQGLGFPIVGIGASAGGLEAFTKFLNHLPTETGMAFVLLQHLDPKHESMSADILSRATTMPVAEVKDGTKAEPNCVYVIPPNFSMGILHGTLNLIPRTETRGQHLVIDFFFQSLAQDQKNLAIGVVLSGTGSDGTQGLSAIKAEGGITFAQTPKTAKFDSMPQSAIASGAVDLILPPEKIAEELVRIAHHSYVRPGSSPEKVASPEQPPKSQDSLTHIFLLLRNQCHVDFSYYKLNTVMRRIERRMVLHKMEDLKEYSEFLSQRPEEVKALFNDILIHVTEFFRDPEAFQALKEEAFPKLMETRTPGVPIRVWVPGCSTGEEVYSVAISLLEFLGDKVSHTPIQIFASDISEQAIQKARIAEYPEAIVRHVSPERRSRYFHKLEGGGYKIVKSIRDLCLFSRHDITADPPFAKIDLISCRNVLIYFSPTLQKHVIPIFHYSLSPNGFLWLGKSETIGGFLDLFSLLNQGNNIYSRKETPIALNLRFPSSTYVHGKQDTVREQKTFVKVTIDVQKTAEQAIHEAFPGVVVNEAMEIVQLRGRPHPFIEPAPGAPSYHLLKMAHPELVRDLRNAIQESRKSKSSVRKDGLSVNEGHKRQLFNLLVIPTKPAPGSKDRLYIILFEKALGSKQTKRKQSKSPLSKNSRRHGKKDPQLLELQHELDEAQENQRSLIQQFEGAQEDLTTANEELQSANEELQSTNEELETAKEELQSGNEELTTVNDELRTRSSEQTETNNDLINLLGSVEIPIVMLGNDRKVRRFTPLAGKALNLIPTDVGRPLSDLNLTFRAAPGTELNLDQIVSKTVETIEAQEIEVQDQKGRWFRLQVRPYKTVDNRIDGAVLAFVDIDSLKLSLKEVREARSEAERANRAKDLFLATLSHELRTPLTSILSWAQMIRSGKLDPEKMRRGAEIIEESGKTQAQLINDLLDVSRIVAGKLSLETREVNPASVVQSAIEAVRSIADAKSIQIETSFAPNIGTILADPVRLQQVFWNLLTNAAKFSAPESKVSVRLDRINGNGGEKAKVMIKITDSGKGIDPEFLPHIFDRFSQEDSSSVRVHGGLGLGLAIVRNLVELHDGTIQAESLGENLGATFTVILPIRSDQELSGAQSIHVDSVNKKTIASDRKPTTLRGLRVLIVDDETNAREAISELLNSFGAETKSAGSAKEALNVFSQFKPDVLVSDIAMPVEDGYSLIKQIRALGAIRGGDVPALAMTAYAGAEDVQRALSAGFQTHLPKPVDSQDLAKTIAKLANKIQ